LKISNVSLRIFASFDTIHPMVNRYEIERKKTHNFALFILGIPLSSIFFTYANYGVNPSINKTTDELVRIQETGQSIYFVALCIM